MITLYYKTRFNSYNLGQGGYTVDYSYNQERPDYLEFIKIYCQIISDDKYCNECKYNNKLVKYLTIVEFDETKTTKTITDIKYDFETFYKSRFQMAELTVEQAKEFIRNNTDLLEFEEGKFTLYDGEYNGEELRNEITIKDILITNEDMTVKKVTYLIIN